VVDVGDRHAGDLISELPLEDQGPLLICGPLLVVASWAERSWHGQFPSIEL
jgi:hypothetical protein